MNRYISTVIILLLNIAICDIITTEVNMSPIYTEVNEIRDIEYLGLSENFLIYYKYYNSREILSLDVKIVTSIYSDNGELINPLDILYSPDLNNLNIPPLDENSLNNYIVKQRKVSINPASVCFIASGISQIMKNKYLYDDDIDSYDELFDNYEKMENYDKLSAYLLIAGGFFLFLDKDEINNDFNYTINPFKNVPTFDLSFTF